jgi:hypothetical protein
MSTEIGFVDRPNVKESNPLVVHGGRVDTWEQLEELLPDELPETLIGLLQTYFEAQLAIKGSNLLKANSVFTDRLLPHQEYLRLEDENPQLLGAIDVLVRGVTNMSLNPELAFNEPSD